MENLSICIIVLTSAATLSTLTCTYVTNYVRGDLGANQTLVWGRFDLQTAWTTLKGLIVRAAQYTLSAIFLWCLDWCLNGGYLSGCISVMLVLGMSYFLGLDLPWNFADTAIYDPINNMFGQVFELVNVLKSHYIW